MTWSYQVYFAVGLSISFGFVFLAFAFLFYLLYRCPKTFYRMIRSMFSIRHHEATKPDGIESIDLYGAVIDLQATARGFIPRFALVLMSTAIMTATFMLFFSQIILIHEYLPPNSKCPSDGDMDCFTITNYTYFHCNSSDTRIDESLGSLICYRWMKENLGAIEVLNQIGLCCGLIQAFGWFVNIYLRLLLHMLQRNKQSASKNPVEISSRQHRLLRMVFKHSAVILISLSPCIVLIVMGARNISQTGITMLILITVLLVSISGILLFLIFENEKFKQGNVAYDKFDTIPVSIPQQDTTEKGTKISMTRIVPIMN